MIDNYFYNLVDNFNSLFYIGTVIVHLLFATGVAKSIAELNRQNASPQIVSGFVWTLATLLGGVFVALTFWIIHYSSLAKNSNF